MTLRTRDQRVYGPNASYTIYNPDTMAVLYSGYVPNTRPNIGSYKSIDSVRDGKFVRGQFRVNPVTIKSGLGVVKPGQYKGLWSAPWWFRTEGNIVPVGVTNLGYFWPTTFNTPDIVRDTGGDGRSIIKAFAKLNDCVWDFAVFLAELHETLEMLRHPFKSMQKWIDAEKKIARRRIGGMRWSDSQPFVHYLVDNWLQYRYGIRPFIKDIQDAIAAFHHKWNLNAMNLQRIHARDVLSSVTTVAGTGSVANLTFSVSETRNMAVETHCSLYYRRHVLDATDKLAELLGLELSNVPSVAWELVKYSFVVDWFLGVGSWLKAIKPNPRIDYLGGCVSQVIQTSQKYEIINPWIDNPSNPATVVVPSTYVWSTKSLVRSVNPTVPVLPSLNPNFYKIERLVDSMALLWRPVVKGLTSRRR